FPVVAGRRQSWPCLVVYYFRFPNAGGATRAAFSPAKPNTNMMSSGRRFGNTFPIAPRFRMMYLPARRTRPKKGASMSKRTLALVAIVCSATLVALALPSHQGLPRAADVHALNVKIQEWSVPSKGGHPHDPAVGPDETLWFTEQM